MGQTLNQTISFRYDGLGRRIEKEVVQKDGTTTRTHYVYNGDNIIFEYDTDQKLVATYLGTGKIDDNLLMIRDGKDYYFHKDHLGSITDITDSVGNVVERIDYSVFGKILNVVDKDGVKTTPIKNPFYFTGREWDEEIGMYYYRARFYDPALGRFLTPDPIGLAGGDANLYRYVKNNPVNAVDPSGLVVLDLTEQISLLKYTPESLALLSSLQNDPTTFVVITSGHANGNFATATGNSKLINITIDQRMHVNSSILANTLTHELTHAHDIRSGNINFSDPSRRDITSAENHAEDVSNPLFDRDNMCR